MNGKRSFTKCRETKKRGFAYLVDVCIKANALHKDKEAQIARYSHVVFFFLIYR